ncbi:MAG: substrate-binding domain-containing protein, partial [Deltaproteobacteria bacterium]|nr:substrate-binding domain-containing protein [Deltaproteobacteria bacterium]
MARIFKLLFFLLTLSFLAGPVWAQNPPAVTTGAGYKSMLEALVKAFREGGGQIEEMYGGHIGQMVAQIAQGSGATMVVSDQATLEAVAGDVQFENFNVLGDTVLVLAYRKGLSLKKPEDLLGQEIKRVAQPDPKGAIYGRAAAAFLKSSGLGERLGDKVMAVESAPQVISYVIAGEVDAGFVNRAVLKAAGDKIGGSLEIPDGYPPIRMVLAVVKGQGDDPGTKAFVE